ncbi:MAG: chemotaxis protein CheB [Candidatus Saccharibacteria bacterium]
MYKAIVIGTSHGGLEALRLILTGLKEGFPLPVFVVLHIGEHNNDSFIRHLNELCALEVKEAEMNEPIFPGTVYFAPPNYHLLIEDDLTLTLSTSEKVNFSRPSVDVLFESAALVYTRHLIGVILTGANSDGANGLRTIKEYGGLAVVQNPCSSTSPAMPRAALKMAKPQLRLKLEDIADHLNQLAFQK